MNKLIVYHLSQSEWGGAVSPTLTCSTEIYVYEVIFDSSNEG